MYKFKVGDNPRVFTETQNDFKRMLAFGDFVKVDKNGKIIKGVGFNDTMTLLDLKKTIKVNKKIKIIMNPEDFSKETEKTTEKK